MQVDLSDKKIFDLVQRSDTTPKEIKVKSDVNKIQETVVVDNCKRQGSLTNFMKKLFIVIFCLLILYLTIFRYILGYKFLKNKDYKKGAAILSPELITVSALLL